MRYAIVLEKGPTSYGAYVPDLPGCIAAAETEEEALKLIREAIELHISSSQGGWFAASAASQLGRIR
jgi:predicted RNase H-like HicB family nuclease